MESFVGQAYPLWAARKDDDPATTSPAELVVGWLVSNEAPPLAILVREGPVVTDGLAFAWTPSDATAAAAAG